MAQIIPPITSLPSDSGAAPSVEDIQDRLPSICVDYLSHNWTEEDVWASWRNMTRHKHEIANGVRLENASWRTWQKQRNKLRTISPETLNWLKDSDVTWLYGPLHTANVEPVRPLKVSSTEDRVGIDRPTTATKPGILKHRTLTELLSLPGPTSPVLDGIEGLGDDSEFGAPRPSIQHTKSETNLHRSNSMPARRRPPPHASSYVGSRNTGGRDSKERSPDSANNSNNRRQITFNTFVEQCMALEEPNLVRPSAADDSEDEDDGMVEMRPSLSPSSSRSRSSSMASTQTNGSMTIQKIAPTMLKTSGSFTNNPTLPRMIYQPSAEYMSPPSETSQPPSIGVTSPFNMGSPLGRVAGRGWNGESEEEYTGVGFDYFGGPDLTGASPRTGTYGRAPSVQLPPAQPKWRQAQSAEIGTSTSSTSSSSSSLATGNTATMGSSPQPGRGILKVRQPSTVQQVPEPVSPPAVFNYNPSVATGIGGMYGSYENAAIAIGSPPNESRAERGRSTSRGSGSSQYDRSNSRGTSTSSASSMGSVSGSVSRSPVEASNAKAAARAQDGAAPAAGTTPEATGHEPMDVDGSPDGASTPTPHSSPQIVFRPLKDTSPSSLPHASSNRPLAPGLAPEPQEQPQSQTQPQQSTLNNSSGTVSPTVTIGNTPNATLSQPADADDDDGSTLIGRATNIANTAKDLLGALWYGGAQEEAPRVRSGSRAHRRGASLG